MHNRVAHLLLQERDRGSKVALRYGHQRITFAELADRVRETAAGLAHCGVRKGTHVGIMIPSTPDFIVVQQALFLLGAVVSPMNVFYRPNEVAHVVSSCDIAYLIMPDDLRDRAPRPDADLPSLLAVIVIDSAADDLPLRRRSLPAAMASAAPVDHAAIAPDDVVMLLNTSATTGKSKGVMLTAANLAANYDRTPAWLGLESDDVILCALPLYNTFGLNQCINAMLVTGATMVLLPRFDAKACLDAIDRYQCTFVPAVPTMLQKMMDAMTPGLTTMTSVRTIMTGGAPVPAALLARVLATASPDAEVLTGYGLTEGTALVTLTPVRLADDGQVERGRTIGRVLDGMTLAIRDEGGRILAADAVGEIVMRGPNVMAGYYRAPEDTAAAIADGWLLSGDLGYVDADGYAFIVDRKKDVIIRGGQNIYPADIEEALYDVAGVAEVAVVGKPDDMFGEVPIAFVALRAGSDLSIAVLIDHCRAELASYKVPYEIIVMPELPKGPTGKILRRALRPALSVTA
jgi:long-chain acyl-CoA synthetase